MALKKCKECGNQVSTKAESCPKCGAVMKVTKKGCSGLVLTIIIGGVILSIVLGSLTDSGNNLSSPKEKTKEETRTEQIEKHFSAWDGSHRGLTEFIKESMNDPDSYQHVKTVFSDKDDHLVIQTTFRGKNAFGGVVKNWVKAKVDLNGNVLGVIEQGP